MTGIATIEPKTWASDDLVRAVTLNTEIRDSLRFLATGAYTTARLSSDQSIPSGVRTNLTWGTVPNDSDGIINEPSDSFTFTRDGVINLRLITQYAPNAGGTTRNFIVIYNGDDFDMVSDQNLTGSGTSALHLSVTFPVRAGDIVGVTTYQDSGSSLAVQSAMTQITLTWGGAIEGTTTDPEELPPSGTPPVPAPSPPPTPVTPTKHSKTYYATWSQSYCPTGITWGDPVNYAYQGYYSSSSGNLRSLIGFNSAGIVNDLTGAQNVQMKFTYYVKHSYYNSGMTVVIGGHKYSTKPGSWSDSSVDQDITRKASPQGSYTSFYFGSTMVNRLKSGLYKGIAFGPGPTTSRLYYGFISGATLASKPRLTVTYYK